MDLLRDVLLAVLAPLGIWFGWALQRRDKNEDRLEKRRELLRGKAEEIYSELEAVLTRSGERVLWALEDASGRASTPKSPPETASRLKALLGMYFPESEPFVQAHKTAVRAALEEAQNRDVAIRLLPDDDQMQAMKDNHYQMVDSMHAAIYELLGQTRTFMDEQVKSLL